MHKFVRVSPRFVRSAPVALREYRQFHLFHAYHSSLFALTSSSWRDQWYWSHVRGRMLAPVRGTIEERYRNHCLANTGPFTDCIMLINDEINVACSNCHWRGARLFVDFAISAIFVISKRVLKEQVASLRRGHFQWQDNHRLKRPKAGARICTTIWSDRHLEIDRDLSRRRILRAAKRLHPMAGDSFQTEVKTSERRGLRKWSIGSLGLLTEKIFHMPQ